MNFLSFLALVLLTTSPIFASDKGNGGDGIIIRGKIYVLDLVESGVEEDPYFDSSIKTDPKIKARIEKILPAKDYPTELLANKIQEIAKLDPIYAQILLRTMELYNWRQVNSALLDIKDETSILAYKNLVQLAVRKNTFILIDKGLWAKLDAKNQAALIFHEVLYAYMKGNNSDHVRELNGYIFSEFFHLQGLEGFIRLAGRPVYYQGGIKVIGDYIYHSFKFEIQRIAIGTREAQDVFVIFDSLGHISDNAIESICSSLINNNQYLLITNSSQRVQVILESWGVHVLKWDRTQTISLMDGLANIIEESKYTPSDLASCKLEVGNLLESKYQQFQKITSEL